MTPEEKSRISARNAAFIVMWTSAASIISDIPSEIAAPINWRKVFLQILIMIASAGVAYQNNLRAYYAPSPDAPKVTGTP